MVGVYVQEPLLVLRLILAMAITVVLARIRVHEGTQAGLLEIKQELILVPKDPMIFT